MSPIPRAFWPVVNAFVTANLAALNATPGLGEVSLTSWFRSPGRNRQVGGSPVSQHLFALATDWQVDNKLGLIREMKRVGLVAIDEGDHVHVQAFPSGHLERLGVRFPT